MSLTLKEKVEIYKEAKKPRREIRIKFDIITNGLQLPKVAACDNKVRNLFRINEVAKIEPQIYFISERYKAMRMKAEKGKENDPDLTKMKNRYQSAKIIN